MMKALAAPTSGKLSVRVAIGTVVMAVSKALVRAIDFVVLAVCARLLTPADYGLVALAVVVVGIAQMLSDFRMSQALIRKPTIEEADYHTAFTLSVLRGFVVGALIFAAAVPIARLLDEPALVDIVRAFALLPVFEGFINQRIAQFEKQLDFSKVMTRDVTAKLGGAAVTIVLAYLWRDYWALVAGVVCTEIVRSAISYTLVPRRPRLGLHGWREFVGFGGWLAAAEAVLRTGREADVVVLGTAVSPTVVGQYSVGSRTGRALTMLAAEPINRPLYSGFAAVAEDKERLKETFYRAQQTKVGLILPVGVGVALVAPELVRVLVGAQWAMAVPVLQVLAPILALVHWGTGANNLAMVENATRRLFHLHVVAFAIRIPALIVGLWLAGFAGVLAARAVSTIPTMVMLMRVAAGLLQEPWTRQLTLPWRSFMACAVMAGAVALVAPALPAAPFGVREALFGLTLKAAVGGASYVATHLALWLAAGRPPGFEATMLALARRTRDRFASAPASEGSVG
jgi:O-antigen/teichoic acid export membrane protein